MGYITGTLSDANPGATLHGLLATELTTEGYELADTVVIGASTYKVWKNPAANNPSGKDWFLSIAFATAGAGALRIGVFEEWNPTTDRAYRFSTYQSAIDVTHRSYAGASAYALNQIMYVDIETSTASFGYWISISKTRIAAIGSVMPTFLQYVGLYDPFPEYAAAAGSLLLPLVAGKVSAGRADAGANLGMTRIPPYPGGSAPYGFLLMPALGASMTTFYPRLPTGNQIFGSAFVASKIELIMNDGASPARFGTLYDVVALPVDTTIARGDTVSVDGSTWVLSSVQSNVAHGIKVS